MILTKDQIHRYMRHILIPEISSIGQKKILDSSTILFGEELDKASLALYYIAATGIGQAHCCIESISNWAELTGSLSDLNNAAKIQLQNGEALENTCIHSGTRIIIGSFSFVRKTLKDIINYEYSPNHIPTIVSIYNGWSGVVQTFIKQSELEAFLAKMDEHAGCSRNNSLNCSDHLSAYFSSLMAVIEHIKLTLSHGKPLSEALYYDLAVMEFDFISSSADMFEKLLNPKVPEKDFEALADSKALIIGCGGLGSSSAFALASLGIGKIGLVDFDAVELSNLNRQIMHSTSRIGMSKVHSAEIFLKKINPNINLETYNTRINKENIQDIISSYDIIIGGLDNLPDRYMLNDACRAAKKPLLEAGVLDISGLATSIIPEVGHCCRYICPESADASSLPSCSETGVLGPVPGVMGIIQAAEAIKLLTGTGESLNNRILLFDVFDTDIYVAEHGKNRFCELCGR